MGNEKYSLVPGYCYMIPDGYPLAKAAPFVVYAPMMRHKMNQPGKSQGVIGLGGLRHMAIKFGTVFGLKVTVQYKCIQEAAALEHLGADEFVITSDEKQMKSEKCHGNNAFDSHTSLLKVHGVLVLVDNPSEVTVHPGSRFHGRKLFQ